MAKRNGWSNQGRFEGMSGLACMCLALVLSVTSITVGAQTVFEFEDPLEEMRTKIERAATGAEADPSPAPTPTPEKVVNTKVAPTTDAKGPITVFAERTGLTTAGLVGLGVLALLALLLGVMWLLGRSRSARTTKRTDRELYALSDGARGRRVLESGAKVTRNRKEFLDTTEQEELAARADASQPSAARKAASILSGDVDLTDNDEDDFVLAYEAETEPDQPPKPAGNSAGAADPGNPDTWRRPNLDRLKASIKEDWKGEQAAPVDPEVAELRSEAEVFADLFGDDTPPAAMKPTQAKSPALDMLDTFDDDTSEPMSVSSLQAAVEKTAPQNPKGTTERAEAPDRHDALRRIKALRESVRAS